MGCRVSDAATGFLLETPLEVGDEDSGGAEPTQRSYATLGGRGWWPDGHSLVVSMILNNQTKTLDHWKFQCFLAGFWVTGERWLA